MVTFSDNVQVRKDFGECLKLVEDTLEQVNGVSLVAEMLCMSGCFSLPTCVVLWPF